MVKRTKRFDIGYHTVETYGKTERWRDNETGKFVSTPKDDCSLPEKRV